MLRVHFIDSLSNIDAKDWNNIAGTDFPFTRHEFLLALESTGAVTISSGWQPQHALIYEGEELVAVMPMYLKHHSYGEYVFDFEWANAYRRHNLNYYPKLVSCIPFTPVCGARLCIKDNSDSDAISQALFTAIQQRTRSEALSSWHLLFPSPTLSKRFQQLGASTRRAIHFRWQNNHYQNFDDFLATFTSRKRKNLRRERQRIDEQGISIKTFTGAAITPDLWQQFSRFYRQTYSEKSGHDGYLDQHFFTLIGETLSEHTVLMLAEFEGRYVAGALNFQDSDHLYGRYWGCSKEFNNLHFELCYYRGIDYCIENGLTYFDPGVQGEHKIQRGFKPHYTYSNHWLEHSGFRAAVERFLHQEEDYLHQYKLDTEAMLPFKSEHTSD